MENGENKLDYFEIKKFYEYAKELADKDYKNYTEMTQSLLKSEDFVDSKSYYEELIKWHADIIINTTEGFAYEDTKHMNSISKNDIIYAHILITGGPYNGKTDVSVDRVNTNGVINKDKDPVKDCQNGTEIWASSYFENPAYAMLGTLTFNIYDGEKNLIGSKSVRITN